MRVRFSCPRCFRACTGEWPVGSAAAAGGSVAALRCGACGWTREVAAEGGAAAGPGALGTGAGGAIAECVLCGCEDLWRQKDFPPRLGLAIVVLGAVASTAAYAWHRPLLALGVLLAFAALDMLLFALMRDVRVCYRCGARYYGDAGGGAAFDLMTAERYRQESARLNAARNAPGAVPPREP